MGDKSARRDDDTDRKSVVEKYPLLFADRTEERKRAITRRRTSAWQTAHRAAHVLRQSFQARRVVVFGSLASPDRFMEWSDIDLAAWGIFPERYFAAVAAVTALSREFDIDLIDPDMCSPTLLHEIREDGIDI